MIAVGEPEEHDTEGKTVPTTVSVHGVAKRIVKVARERYRRGERLMLLPGISIASVIHPPYSVFQVPAPLVVAIKEAIPDQSCIPKPQRPAAMKAMNAIWSDRQGITVKDASMTGIDDKPLGYGGFASKDLEAAHPIAFWGELFHGVSYLTVCTCMCPIVGCDCTCDYQISAVK